MRRSTVAATSTGLRTRVRLIYRVVGTWEADDRAYARPIAAPLEHDVDLIIGCVDHDGPRHRLNQIAVATRTPYIDIATGVDDTGGRPALGGRIVLVVPDGPCLTCLGELDSAEISRWAKPAAQQALDRAHGYGTGSANPPVVYPQRARRQRRYGRTGGVDLRGSTARPVARHRSSRQSDPAGQPDRTSAGRGTNPWMHRLRSTHSPRAHDNRCLLGVYAICFDSFSREPWKATITT
jgi:hypothetical protein